MRGRRFRSSFLPGERHGLQLSVFSTELNQCQWVRPLQGPLVRNELRQNSFEKIRSHQHHGDLSCVAKIPSPAPCAVLTPGALSVYSQSSEIPGVAKRSKPYFSTCEGVIYCAENRMPLAIHEYSDYT